MTFNFNEPAFYARTALPGLGQPVEKNSPEKGATRAALQSKAAPVPPSQGLQPVTIKGA